MSVEVGYFVTVVVVEGLGGKVGLMMIVGVDKLVDEVGFRVIAVVYGLETKVGLMATGVVDEVERMVTRVA